MRFMDIVQLTFLKFVYGLNKTFLVGICLKFVFCGTFYRFLLFDKPSREQLFGVTELSKKQVVQNFGFEKSKHFTTCWLKFFFV